MQQKTASLDRHLYPPELVLPLRKREKGALVYPAYSRRSGGLSVGINLFPGEKHCSFDCPYCEVFPFMTNVTFSREQMEEELRSVLKDAGERNLKVMDICFSGNGEPTLSPAFPEALEIAGRVRKELLPAANLVLISNGTGLLNEQIFSLLKNAVSSIELDIWLKLDAGTPGWYDKMSHSDIPFETITGKIREFASSAAVTIQTMLCMVDGKAPPPEEDEAWEKLVIELPLLRKVQIYGKARPSPGDPKAEALPEAYLEKRAVSLRRALAAANSRVTMPKIEVFP
jgi:histidinol dehydrogenase